MESIAKAMEELFKAILPAAIVTIAGLLIEYKWFVPNSQSTGNKEKEKVQSLLFGRMFILLMSIAFIYGLNQLWSVFSLVVVYVVFFGIIVFVGLHIHNVFYQATFLRLKYYQQYFNERYADAVKTLQEIALARPNDISPLLEQANIYLEKTQDYRLANSTLLQVLQKTGDNYGTLDMLRKSYWGLLFQNPDDQETLLGLINTILRLLAIDPENSDLVCEFARIYFHYREYQTGMSKINEFLERLSKSTQWAYENQNTEIAKATFVKVINDQNKIIELLRYTILPDNTNQ